MTVVTPEHNSPPKVCGISPTHAAASITNKEEVWNRHVIQRNLPESRGIQWNPVDPVESPSEPGITTSKTKKPTFQALSRPSNRA